MSVNNLTVVGPPQMPSWLLILRGVIIVLSLGVLVAAAYNLSLFGGYSTYLSGYSGPSGFLIFDAIFTWLILGVMIFFEFSLHKLYVRIMFIVLLVLADIFWLSAWAWAASVASSFFSLVGNDHLEGAFAGYGASMAAGAALGALNWVLMVVTTVFFVIACMREDGDGGFRSHDTELAQPKPQPVVQSTQVVEHPQPSNQIVEHPQPSNQVVEHPQPQQ